VVKRIIVVTFLRIMLVLKLIEIKLLRWCWRYCFYSNSDIPKDVSI